MGDCVYGAGIDISGRNYRCRALEQTSMIYIFAVLLDLGIASKCIFPVSKLDMRSKKDQKYRGKKIGIKDSRRTTACEVAFR